MVLTANEFFGGHPSEEQEVSFWRSIQLPNRTFKTTNERRLGDLNAHTIDYWKSEGFAPRAVLDVAVSSGITSVEWLAAMNAAGYDPKMTATDISLNAKILRPLPFYRVLVRDTEKMEPLQHDLMGRPFYPYFNYGLRSLIGATMTLVLYRTLRALVHPMKTERQVKLVSPRARMQAQISFIEDDLFDAASKPRLGGFDVIRAANILNAGYFQADELKKALVNLKGLLRGPGAFLIVVRTLADDTNHGTMFRLNQAGHFDAILSIGSGSEIADLVLAA